MQDRDPRPTGIVVRAAALAASVAVLGAGTAGGSGEAAGAAGHGRHPAASPAALRFASTAGRIQRRAAQRWPGSFAGAWLSRGQLELAFTNSTRRRVRKLRRTVPAPRRRRLRLARRLKAVHRLYSLSYLSGLERRMGIDRDNEVIGPRYDLDVDVRTNRVVATVLDGEATPEVLAEFKSLYGPAVRVRSGPLSRPDACSRASCAYDLRSGLQVTYQDGGKWHFCSTAFKLVHHGSLNKYFDFMLSASHCGGDDVGAIRYHGEPTRKRIGTVGYELRSGPTDAEIIRVERPYRVKPWAYANDGEKAIKVDRLAHYATALVGQRICKAGATTGETCGLIKSTHYSPDYIPNSYDFIKSDMCAQPGDSGAGVYYPYRMRPGPPVRHFMAFGILSGGSSVKNADGGFDPLPCSDPGFYSVSGHISFNIPPFNFGIYLSPTP